MAAYPPTTWVNDTTPAISAANLNKLTEEIKRQGNETGVAHTLPTWVDGTAPAVSDPVPLNEMERVLLAVAVIKGLAYTRDTWQAGWVPARNAARLNNMELQAQENRAALDVSFGSPLGFFSNASPGYFPASNIGSYRVIPALGPPPGGFTGVNLRYMSAITCQDGTNGISSATAISNNWAMRDSNGAYLTNVSYSGNLADPGIANYRAAWCNLMLTRVQQAGSQGAWIDDSNPRITSISGGVRPANYPTDASYETALLGFAAYVKAFCDTNGIKCGYNTVVPLDDNASLTTAWWARIGPSSHYLTAEGWLTPLGFNYIRLSTPVAWYNFWNEHRALHTACINAGTGFLPLTVDRAQVYGLATFLLDWNGTGAYMWVPSDTYLTTTDPWISQYATAVQLGAPSGAAVLSGDVWTRQFANGTVSVNPVNGTASIT